MVWDVSNILLVLSAGYTGVLPLWKSTEWCSKGLGKLNKKFLEKEAAE